MSFLKNLFPVRQDTACGAITHPKNTEAQPEATALPGIRPKCEISEAATGWTLKAAMPGVSKETLAVTECDGVITVRGERVWKQPATWTARHRETSDRPFEFTLRHENHIALDRVQATLADGVLTLTLPKHEQQQPRKIAVS